MPFEAIQSDPLPPATILAVDDQVMNLSIVEEFLKRDYQVRLAESGAQALEMVAAEPVDLILLDIRMPDMDGYEVCRRLKSALLFRDIPVIFLTIDELRGEETTGFELGAVDYIIKPVTPAVLRARVATHVALYRARKKLARQVESFELALAGGGLGLWQMDVAREHYALSAHAWAMLGYDSTQFDTSLTHWDQLLHSDDIWAFRAARTAHLAGQTALFEVEFRIRHQSGRWLWLYSRGKVVSRDQKGHPQLFAGTLLDISDRKQLKVEGIELLRRLEDLILHLREHPHALAAALPAAAEESAQGTLLTTRQQEVLHLIARGLSSTRIAEELDIAHDTVISHRRILMKRLNVHNVAELIQCARAHGLLEE